MVYDTTGDEEKVGRRYDMQEGVNEDEDEKRKWSVGYSFVDVRRSSLR